MSLIQTESLGKHYGGSVLSIQHYVTSIGQSLGGRAVLEVTSLPVVAATVLALLVAVAGTAAATARLRSFALTGETA